MPHGIISNYIRYDLHWGVNGVGHFLDAENILNKFLPFVHEVSLMEHEIIYSHLINLDHIQHECQ